MGRNTAVEPDGVSVVDNLVENETLVLRTGRKGTRGGSLVTDFKSRGLGHGVGAGTPLERNGVADGSIGGEGDIS